MDCYSENFFRSICKSPNHRTDEDLRTIYLNLRRLDIFHNLNDAPLRAICHSARYEQHPANFILFRQGQVATCWYILLTGSVFMDKQMHLPYGCFGKRNGLNYRRTSDCILLQDSEMIVIDYPDVKHITVNQESAKYKGSVTPQMRKSVHSMNLDPVPVKRPIACSFPAESTSSGLTCESTPPPSAPPPPPPPPLPPQRIRKSSNRMCSSSPQIPPHSYHSDHKIPYGYKITEGVVKVDNATHPDSTCHKSQIFLNGSSMDEGVITRVKHRTVKSNSITGSVSNSSQRQTRLSSTASSSTNDDDLHGLPETAVDSEEDDESCPSHDSFCELRDSVRECLEKEPSERTADDISILLDFMQHMSALASLPLSIKKQLCLKMVFAVVAEAGTVVMQHNERLDAWSVIVNGQVEVIHPNGERYEYKLGDSFGAKPILTTQYHTGEMRTMVDDCEFVLVEHRDYCAIMSKIGEHIKKHSDHLTGEIVSETERRAIGNQIGQVLIKANKDKLIEHLIEDRDTVMDAHYVEDFLLMYRVFITDPTMIFEKLMHWFAESIHRDKVARIVLLWTNNHFNDFECNSEMLELLDRFEQALERDQMYSQQSLLNIARSVKSRQKVLTYTRSDRDQPLAFSLLGGKENGSAGIFISNVQPKSHAEKIGLRKADQIIEVNGQSFKSISLPRALEILRGNTHVSITVKSNLLGFKEMISQSERAVDVDESFVASPSGRYAKNKPFHQNSRSSAANTCEIPSKYNSGHSRMRFLGSGSSTGKVSVMDKILTMLKGQPGGSSDGYLIDYHNLDSMRTNPLRASRSNPDIVGCSVSPLNTSTHSIAQYYQPTRSVCPEHVLKVYRADQSFKYLTVYKETTAQNVVQLALQEFGMNTDSGSLDWSLCEASVTPDGVIKQRRLPDHLTNLAEIIQLNSRYYLKNNAKSEQFVPDDLAPELLKEAEINLLHLNAQILAAQLTLQDFAVFASIEATEYVDNLFDLESKYGWPKLTEFEALFNREMWWVATEICTEKGSVHKRAKLIKKFIKIARHCREFRNFNSMFAIISGLDKPAVRRLHHTWERVPTKYIKTLEDIQHLVDPSRNMSKYRHHLSLVSQEPPVIPIYPISKKDLTFTHEGNPTYCEKLVNFEKLRMIAKAIRSLTKLCGTPYEIRAMSQQSGGGVSDALLHMNTFDGGTATVATMRRAGSSAAKSGSQPRKKMYEQALMVRKVKSYLNSKTVVDRDADLDRLSMECEVSISSANTSRRRAPSPSPSSMSSLSSTSEQRKMNAPKFDFVGVESPQAVQKMLSLVQTSRTKHQGLGSGISISGNAHSPVIPIKNARGKNVTHQRIPSSSLGRPHSNAISDIQPVDLSAESSSVTSLYASSSTDKGMESSHNYGGKSTSANPKIANYFLSSTTFVPFNQKPSPFYMDIQRNRSHASACIIPVQIIPRMGKYADVQQYARHINSKRQRKQSGVSG